MKHSLISIATLLFIACTTKQQADLIVTNANVYTVNSNFENTQAFAIRNGKFIGVGTNEEITSKFKSDSIINANEKTIVPGLIDTHCHFYELGLQQKTVDLTNTKSFNEVVKRIFEFQNKYHVNYITGWGWDQNKWERKDFPTNDILNHAFPNTPIAISRIDGHTLLANEAAIKLANVTIKTLFSGGEILQKNGKLTGIFIDNPMDLILKTIPKPSKKNQIDALQAAEKICFSYGLTTVDDAGLPRQTIDLIDSLQQAKALKMRMYVMVSNSPEDVDYYLNKGIIKTDRLNVRSIKVYADGALGSRGAALKKQYYDAPNHYGALLSKPEEFIAIAKKIANSNYQMNTHAIGDSANYVMLKIYEEVLKGKNNRRWRIEHAQIIDPKDFHYFKNIFPSIQPTHATSDMYWAEKRLGAERMKGAYAYKELLNKYGKVALGTDFPVEKVSPFLTFYAAVARKDLNNFPENGFEPENALTREETLKGMTIWAASANFEENEKGSIEVGKDADFVILSDDIMKVDLNKIPTTKALETYLAGEKVH